MENKVEFLEKVSELFVQNGAKTLTMDDIAKEFAMSKKTLYQFYANKDALLEEVLDYKLNSIIQNLRKKEEGAGCPIENMLCKEEELEKATETNKSILLRQLLKYYPAIFNKHIIRFSEKFSEIVMLNIQKGRSQGYYRDDFDAFLYSKLLFQLALCYENSPFLESSFPDRQSYDEEVMMFYLHAITTEKGKEILIKIKKDNEKKAN